MGVSLMEGRRLPFFGAQFHPEKNGFEFDQMWDSKADAIHSPAGIQMAQYFANAFVNQCRQNNHKPSDLRWLKDHLIYNFASLYTSTLFPNQNLWEQTYVFQLGQD